mmetsp:Transcript_16733/g.37534  ORF Transcript_16733/g.37534 Transcript_16733/m.37534 type:complete len:92 (+) Transcript_16733:184-459(+)
MPSRGQKEKAQCLRRRQKPPRPGGWVTASTARGTLEAVRTPSGKNGINDVTEVGRTPAGKNGIVDVTEVGAIGNAQRRARALGKQTKDGQS